MRQDGPLPARCAFLTSCRAMQMQNVLTQDRGKLLEIILGPAKGSRSQLPSSLQSVLNDLTDAICLLSDTLQAAKP